MLFLNSYDVTERILKRLGVSLDLILRFDGGEHFNSSCSSLEPHALLEMIGRLSDMGFEFIGGWTDRGVNKLVDVYRNVRGWLASEREGVGFNNLYALYLRKVRPPSGILVLTSQVLIFIPGVIDPWEAFFIKLTGIPQSEKLRVEEQSGHHGLKWYGEPSHPILYRRAKPSADNAQEFVEDVLSFLEEAGYPEI
ncbi:MAG: hypothetical protein QXH67_00815 [Candidatus Bathyarchaeia archaeon]